MFAHNTKQGDWVELRLPEREPGRYALELFMTKAADYGIVAVYVNEIQLGTFDLMSSRDVVPSGALQLGDVQLGGRKNVLRLEVVGKNPNAAPPFYQFAIDGLRIGKAASAASRKPVSRAAPEAEPITSESDTERASTDGG